MVKIRVLIVCFFLPFALIGQTNRYMVFLSDKSGSAFSVDQPEDFLSMKAIERRNNQSIAVTVEDLPVNQTYIDDIKGLGVEVYFTTKWLNAALIQTDQSNISAVEGLSFVDSVVFIAPNERLSFGSRKSAEEDTEDTHAENNTQLSFLGIDDLHAEQYLGEGVSIAFLDGGFLDVDDSPFFVDLFTENRMVHQYNFVENSTAVFKSSTHGTRVFSTVAAFSEEYVGVAHQSDFLLYLTEDVSSEFRIEEYNWLIAAEKADSAGVDIINSSVGYNIFDNPSMSYEYDDLDGQTAIITQAASLATSKGILVVTSAGNEGNKSWGFITAPADAENILAVGSVDANRARSSFSSLGPSADGRIKPDVMALGSSTVLVSSSGITSGNGTSFASPQIAGMAALLWQANPTLTNLELRQLIIDISSQSTDPDNQLGYGIPKYLPDGVTGFSPASANQKDFIIFPNPTVGDHLTVQLKGVKKNIELLIYSTTGREMKGYHFDTAAEDSLAVDVSELPKGTYVIKVINNHGVYKARFVKF